MIHAPDSFIQPTVKIMIQHAGRNPLNTLPIKILIHQLIRPIQRPRIHINDTQVLPKPLCINRLVGKIDLPIRRVYEFGRIKGMQDRRIDSTDRIFE